jgi:hypothetical protein
VPYSNRTRKYLTRQIQAAALNARDSLIRQLYEPANHYIQIRIGSIIKENNMIHGSGEMFGEMRYQGKAYRHVPKNGKYQYYSQYELDPGLVDRFKEILKDKNAVEEERKYVYRSLSIFLSLDLNSKDFKDVLGDNIYDMISDYLNYLKFKPETEYSKVMEISKEYQNLKEKIQNRIVDNLISQGLYER